MNTNFIYIDESTSYKKALEIMKKEHISQVPVINKKGIIIDLVLLHEMLEKVRVNTISQSPTVTTAGSGVSGFDKFISFSENMSPLGNAGAVDCANFCVTMFSDLTKFVTMQNLFHDGGFSSTGVTSAVMDRFEEK